MRRLRASGKIKDDPVPDEPLGHVIAGVDESVFIANAKLNSSRSRRERKDSVTPEILRERLVHLQRISTSAFDTSLSDVKKLAEMGLGQKTRKHQVYKFDGTTGAGGKAQHIGSAKDNFPIFKHVLPEIALAGHTNSGKSTLANALAGINPKNGPAGVSDRAGWTDLVCFYQLGKLPPVLNIVDLPGYGHAIANVKAVHDWSLMIRRYFTNRHVISRCCVLVDSCRGLCLGDKTLIRMLHKNGIQVQIVMTKADLLTVDLLAQSIAAVRHDVKELLDAIERDSSRPKKEQRNEPNIIATDMSSKETDEDKYDVRNSANIDLDSTEFEGKVNASGSDMTELATESTLCPSPVEDTEPYSSDSAIAGLTELNGENVICVENEDDLFGDEVIFIPVETVKAASSQNNQMKDVKNVKGVSARLLSDLKPAKKVINKSAPYQVVGNITKAGEWPQRLPDSQIVVAVSGATGAGVHELWRQIKDCARATVSSRSSNGAILPSHAVLEHVNCNLLRRQSVNRHITLQDVLTDRVKVAKQSSKKGRPVL